LWIQANSLRAGFTPSGAAVQKKMCGPLLYDYPLDCLHPTHPVVIIDILLRTRTLGLLLQQRATQNRCLYSLIIISIFLACYHVAKMKKNIVLLWGPLFVGALFGRTC